MHAMKRRPHTSGSILTLIAALTVLFPQPPHTLGASALAPVAYVAPDGDDARDCATPATRCATLQRALDQLADGGEVRMAAGSYPGAAKLSRPAVLSGGYALPSFSPGLNPTVLDSQRNATTVQVVGPGWFRIQQIEITGGLAADGPQQGRGGGIYVHNANLILDRVKVYGNIAGAGAYGAGGGMYISDGAVMASRSSFSANIALQWSSASSPEDAIPTGQGGGVYAFAARVVLQDSLVSDNRAVGSEKSSPATASAAGGGVYAESSVFASMNTRFVGNAALAGPGADGTGGGLRLVNSRALIDKGEISANAASTADGASGGGGAAILGGEAQLSNIALRGNSAGPSGAGSGAGILAQPTQASAALTLTNVLLADHPGAALALLPGQGGAARADVRYATLRANDTGMQAGPGQTISVIDSIIAESQVAVQADEGGAIKLEYVDRYANLIDEQGAITIGPQGDLALPPGFEDPGDGMARLDPASALIDQGRPIVGVDSDFEQQPRPIDGDGDGVAQPDLGWDELARSAAEFGPNPTLFAQPGQTITTTIGLRNVGLAGDAFQISVGAPEGWSAEVQPNFAPLAPRSAVRLTIVIHVPAAARWNSQGTLILHAQGRTSAATALIAVDVGEP